MKRYRLIVFMIICSLLTACGQTTSVLRENSIKSVSDISKSITDDDVSMNTEEEVDKTITNGPQLKEYYSGWREAYLDCMDYIIWLNCEETAKKFWIREVEDKDIEDAKERFEFELIHIDDDGIPELFVTTKTPVRGCYIVSFIDNRPLYGHFYTDEIRYIRKEGKINIDDGKEDVVIKLETGSFNVIYETQSTKGENNDEKSKYFNKYESLSTYGHSYNKMRTELNIGRSLGIAEGDGYTDWARVYLQYMKEIPGKWYESKEDDAEFYLFTSSFSLIYLDDDDIPELFISSNTIPYGEMVVTVSDGKAVDCYLPRDASYYIPREGYIENNIREWIDIIKLESGQFVEVAYGDCYEHYDEDEKEYDWYTWMDERVSREKFYSNMAKLYDKDKLVYLHENEYPYWEMVSILKTGHTTSVNHRYEVVNANVTWNEAFGLARERGGYLAVISSDEEYDVVAKVIEETNDSTELFYVAGREINEGSGNALAWTYADGKEEISSRPNYHYYWDEWEDNWDAFEKGYAAWHDQWGRDYLKICEYGVLKYNKELSSVFLNLAPVDILKYAPKYVGKIGYIIEYDDQNPKVKENYSDWHEAYADFIEYQAWEDAEESATNHGKTVDEEGINWTKAHNSYDLIYVDGDDVPELFISTNSTAGGCVVATYYDGKCIWDYIADETTNYIPYCGYLYTNDGKAFFDIKKLEKGKFDIVMSGEFHRYCPEENSDKEVCDYWLDNASNSITEKEFQEKIKTFINIEESIYPKGSYNYQGITSILSSVKSK